MYCTVEEVLKMIKDDMKNVIIGDEYIEDAEEREAKIAELCDDAISDACAEIDGYLAKRYSVWSVSRRVRLHVAMSSIWSV